MGLEIRVVVSKIHQKGSKSRSLWLVLAAWFLWSLFPLCSADARMPPEAKKGVLDLRGWDLQSDGPVSLSGEWAFFWNRLVEPEDTDTPDLLEKAHLIRLPGTWDSLSRDGLDISGTGFGTCHLVLLLKTRDECAMLKALSLLRKSLYISVKDTA